MQRAGCGMREAESACCSQTSVILSAASPRAQSKDLVEEYPLALYLLARELIMCVSTMMARDHDYCVYLLTNYARTVLYIGVTSDLEGRLYEHITRVHPGGFTGRYQVDRLVCYEQFGDVLTAIEREKQLKGWTRAKKNALVARSNPLWADLSADWPALRGLRGP